MNLAPHYDRPIAVTPTDWPVVTGLSDASLHIQGVPAADLGWRDFFLDPRLRNTVALAIERNQDLQVAALNIELARERYRQAGAALFPTVTAAGNIDISGTGGGNVNTVNPTGVGNAGTGTATGTGTVSGITTPGTDTGGGVGISVGGSDVTKSESLQLGFSSYELDFFGRLRNQKQAALEALRSSAFTQRSTQISLVAEVANDWLTLAADQELLALARATLANQRDNLRLVLARHAFGIASGSEVANARSTVETARVDVATFTTDVAQDRNALNLVAGAVVPVADLPGNHVPDAPVIDRLPAGVPSTVLLDRPDVRAAEYTLRGDYASIGAARAAFFPTISLTATSGWATSGLSGLLTPDNHVWDISPQAGVPIFDGGANQAALDITKTQKKIDVAHYQQTIQTAFSEVADALATRATIAEQVAAQQALVAANARAYRLSLARYRYGVDSFLDTLVDQRALYTARQDEVSRRLSQQTNLVTLYKVLGGGGLAVTPPNLTALPRSVAGTRQVSSSDPRSLVLDGPPFRAP